ncbi:MAG: nicotinate-nucleotide adenylyltransferase [Candidatus Methylomirabilia bacterium]
MSRIGVFGGSFNPIHLGHLLLADELYELLALDRVLFVPAGQPPHKPAWDLVGAERRYTMTVLAVRGNPHFAVSDIELKRPGPSYTVDTLTALHRAAAGETPTFFLLIGSEMFLDLLSWREPQRLASLARIVVVPRTGSAFDPDGVQAQKVLHEIGQDRWVRVSADAPLSVPEPPTGVFLAAATSLPISASKLRRRARLGRSLRYRVPDAVADYIATHRLYREEG